MLKVNNITKSFGKTEVLKGVNLEVNDGERVVVIGPSGGGKTTLLRCINALEKCDNGTIEFNNKALCKDGKYGDKNQTASYRQEIGMVFQNFNLFPHMSVIDNMLLSPVMVSRKNKDEVREEAIKILSFLDIVDKKDNYPYELSGGQKQRAAIARALAMNPKLICFDEPTSALDPSMTSDVSRLIKRLSTSGMSMLIITHDMEFAKNTADRIISMKNGELLNENIYA